MLTFFLFSVRISVPYSHKTFQPTTPLLPLSLTKALHLFPPSLTFLHRCTLLCTLCTQFSCVLYLRAIRLAALYINLDRSEVVCRRTPSARPAQPRKRMAPPCRTLMSQAPPSLARLSPNLALRMHCAAVRWSVLCLLYFTLPSPRSLYLVPSLFPHCYLLLRPVRHLFLFSS